MLDLLSWSWSYSSCEQPCMGAGSLNLTPLGIGFLMLLPQPLKLLFTLVSASPAYISRRQELPGPKELGNDFSFISMHSKRFLESPSFGVCCCLFWDVKAEANWINNSVQWGIVASMLFEPECACIIGEIIGERVFCCGRCGLNPSAQHSI